MDNDKPECEDQVVDPILFSRDEDGCEDDLEADGQQINVLTCVLSIALGDVIGNLLAFSTHILRVMFDHLVSW